MGIYEDNLLCLENPFQLVSNIRASVFLYSKYHPFNDTD